jgi:hypothetical protein
MFDIIYLAVALLFFLACWGLLILCERLMD